MFQLELLRRFWRRPWAEKMNSVNSRVRRIGNKFLQTSPVPIRLPYGGWWFGAINSCRNAIVERRFEEAEWRFVKKFLKPGMVLLDIGAHHGFYTILASKQVGAEGRVVAFEPSPRERRNLAINLRLNHCTNVTVEPFAVSEKDEEAPFFVVGRRQSVFNSLQLPSGQGFTKAIRVKTVTLDCYIENEQIQYVDFVKIDAEGAELGILSGAQESFGKKFRPLIMIEASDLRTAQWGYRASDIRDALSRLGYGWFVPGPNGQLHFCQNGNGHYNFVAIPEEKLDAFCEFIDLRSKVKQTADRS